MISSSLKRGRNDWWYEAMTKKKKNHKKHSSVLKICESVACTILLQDEGGRKGERGPAYQ